MGAVLRIINDSEPRKIQQQKQQLTSNLSQAEVCGFWDIADFDFYKLDNTEGGRPKQWWREKLTTPLFIYPEA